MGNYNDWKARGSPSDEDGSPQLRNFKQIQDDSTIVNDTNLDDSTLYSAVTASVLSGKSPRKATPKKKKLLFSTASHAMELECSTTNDNQLPGSSSTLPTSMKPEELLKLLQNSAPAGYKYCLTVVPREIDSMEKVLKSRI